MLLLRMRLDAGLSVEVGLESRSHLVDGAMEVVLGLGVGAEEVALLRAEGDTGE